VTELIWHAQWPATDFPILSHSSRTTNQRSAIIWGFALFIVGVGLALVGIAFLPAFKTENVIQDLAQKLGGGFISTLSAFPLKEYLARRDRLRILVAIDRQISDIRHQPDPPEEHVKQLETLIWEIYKKGATG
jgi:hypothetical protein